MTGTTAVLLVLLGIVIALGWLVILLYRAVDRAYKQTDSPSPGLEPGSEFPSLEVVADEGLQPLDLSAVSAESISLVLFANGTCETCQNMFSAGFPAELSDTPVTILVTQGDSFHDMAVAMDSSSLTVEYLADPADAWHLARVDQVPFLYVLREGRVVKGGLVTSFGEVVAAVSDARKIMAESIAYGG